MVRGKHFYGHFADLQRDCQVGLWTGSKLLGILFLGERQKRIIAVGFLTPRQSANLSPKTKTEKKE